MCTWLGITDPHLNHVCDEDRELWFQQIASHGRDGIVISGDISEGDDVVFQLTRIADQISGPVYFVLGNHDFYQSSIGRTRQSVIRPCRDHKQLVYLTDCAAIEIDSGRYLVGEDGWGDATEGSYENSYVHLNDFRLIDDFSQAPPDGWKRQLQQQGKESAERLQAKLKALPRETQEVLVLTHVPPYREACWYEGRTTDDNWAPFFVCGQVGQVLRRAAKTRDTTKFTVLCGHAHHAGVVNIAANLTVYAGAAEYGKPEVEGLIKIDEGGIRVDILMR